MIEFHNVNFSYDGNENILNNVSLEVPPGLTLLVGPNGYGKSTLLKLASGIERPDSGSISIAGFNLWKEEVPARQQLAYLPEHPDLTPYASIKDILMLVGRLRGETSEAIFSALDFFSINEVSNRTLRKLSKGQRRRAVFAAVLLGSPTYFLLDEPLEGLDREIQTKILEWIRKRLEKGATFVVVSHMLEPFIALTDHVLTLRDGNAKFTKTLPQSMEETGALLDTLARGN